MISLLIKRLLPVIWLGVITACMPVDNAIDSRSIKRVWPPAPEQPRVAFEYAFSNAEELGIGRGFWQWLLEILAGDEDIRMIRPMAVVISSDGIIYVADPGVRGVHRFDRENHQYDLIRRKNDAPLPSPVGLAINEQNEVFLADSELKQLFRIAPGDEFAAVFELDQALSQPTGLAIDRSTGRLFVVDTAKHRILLFDPQGKLIKAIGHRGAKAGEFNFPTMIWHRQDGRILVTDSLNFRIQTFTDKGQYIGQFGQLGDATGYHARPKGVATDDAGRVYVVDSLFHSVQMFKDSGKFLLNIGEQGKSEGQFWLPTGIYIDGARRIYVADSHNRRIQVFRYIGDDL